MDMRLSDMNHVPQSLGSEINDQRLIKSYQKLGPLSLKLSGHWTQRILQSSSVYGSGARTSITLGGGPSLYPGQAGPRPRI